MKTVYLDWASTAPVSKAAKKVCRGALEVFGNPSSPHAEGVRASELLEDSRRTIARLAGVKPDGVIFTSGATEANNLAIVGHVHALRALGRASSEIHLLYLPSAHASVVETMQALAMEGVQIETLELLDGQINLAKLKTQLRPETTLVSVDLICGETGTKFATRDVRRVLDAAETASAMKRAHILLHVDASQAPFVESYEHGHLGADLITLDAQKVGGVRGVGALVRANTLIPLASIMQGGGQEFGLRSGTPNPALVAAFARALMDAHDGREAFVERARSARSVLLATLSQAFPTEIPMAANVGKEYAPHILNVSFPGFDTDYAVMLLSEAGFAVSTKSACESDARGSRAVLAFSEDSSRAAATLRISWGPSTEEKELKEFARALIRTINFLATRNTL